jgi:outer membrane protein assembly factor BamB
MALRHYCWGTAGLLLIVSLTGFWYVDSQAAQSDTARLRKLRKATLPAATSEPTGSSDWPQWRGPLRNGVSPETGLLTEWDPDGPPIMWKAPAGLGYSSLAVSAGRVLTLIQDGDKEAAICWDAETGQELWRYPYASSPLSLDHGDGPRSTPTVDGDRAYFLGAAGILHCLRVTDGQMLWRHGLAEEFGVKGDFRKSAYWGYACSPLVDGDRLFTITGGTTNNALAAFDKHTGKLIWAAHDDPASYSSPIAVTIDGRRQIVFFTGYGLVGLAPEDGSTLWRYAWQTNDNCNIATPIAVGSYLFISSAYDRGCALLEITRNGDRWSTGLVYSHKRMRNHFSTSVLYDENVYGFDNTTLVCMEFRTGKIRWKQSGFGKGSLLVADRHLLILGENGKLVLAETSPEEYRETASLELPSRRTWTVPALSGGRLYVRDQQQILCLDLRKR